MRQFFTAAIMVLGFQNVALADHASDAAVEKAHEVSEALEAITVKALKAGDNAAMNGNQNRVQKMNAIADASSYTSLKFYKSVVRKLKTGAGINRAGQAFSRMSDSFFDIENKIESLYGNGFQRQLADMKSSLNELRRTFRRGGGGGGGRPTPPRTNITASCKGTFGGNFFDKKTSVQCTVYGKGAVGYEIKFSNPETRASAATYGQLNSRSNSQSFKTENVHVGRSAQYTVFVKTANGRSIRVASGVATGNPF